MDAAVGARARPQVLVVDDDPVMRSLAVRLLERRLGVRVQVACGAMQALGLLRRGRFDAIVVDLAMPEMSGQEFIGRARTLFPDLPVGVWSATPDSLQDEKADFVVGKSPRVDELVRALASTLGLDRPHAH